MALSHEDLLLVILMDGRWHSLHEILRRHPMMVHSRAAGLRAKGYDVQHRCTGKGSIGSEYRLRQPGAINADRPHAEGDRSAGSGHSLSLSGRAETRAGAEGRLGSPAGCLPDPRGSEIHAHPPARPLNDRPLSRPGESCDQEPTTAGSPGVRARLRGSKAAAMTPLSPGQLSGHVPSAAAADSPVAAPAAHLSCPGAGDRESLLAPGQLVLEVAA